jgi:hypothetical protein
MGKRLRKMKSYTPRKRRTKSEINKQELHDLAHKLNSEVGSLIVFIEEKNLSQIPAAQQKAKSCLLKHSDEMKKIAEKIGERTAKAVREYLDSVDLIIHSSSPWVDDSKIRHCFKMGENLEKEFSA